MQFTAIHRGKNTALKSALFGALCAFGFASSPLVATASGDPTATEQSVAIAAPQPGVVTMAPIPDVEEGKTSTLEAGDARSSGDKTQSEKNCLATAIYFEARGEIVKGQKAVAEVILARARTPGRPKTICGVVYEGSQRSTGCQFSFACDRASDVARKDAAWTRAQRIATAAMRTRGKIHPVAGGATFYHASYMTPRWASHMVKVAQIGTQIFYRP